MMRKPRVSKGVIDEESLSVGPPDDTPKNSRRVQGWAKARAKESGIAQDPLMGVGRDPAEKDFALIQAELKNNYLNKSSAGRLDKTIKQGVQSILNGINGEFGPKYQYTKPEQIFVALLTVLRDPNFTQKEFVKTAFFPFIDSMMKKSDYEKYIIAALNTETPDKSGNQSRSYKDILSEIPALQDTDLQIRLEALVPKEESPRPE